MKLIQKSQLITIISVLAVSILQCSSVEPSSSLRKDFLTTDGPVFAIIETNGILYLGGQFGHVGVNSGGGFIADLATGSPLPGVPEVDGLIRSVAPDATGGFYIGGDFTSVGGVTRSRLAHIRADGTLDTGFNPAPNGSVFALNLSGATLYVGGSFTRLGNQNRNRLGAVDAGSGVASAWNPNSSGDVYAFAVSGSRIYVGGSFTNVGGEIRNNLAAIDAVEAAAVAGFDPAPSGPVQALALGGSDLFLGGSFTNVSGEARSHLAAVHSFTGSLRLWNPSADGPVSALVVANGIVYAGGEFGLIGLERRANVAAIDPGNALATAWNPSPSGKVNALANSGSSLFIGGNFTNVAGLRRPHLAIVDLATGAPNAIALNPSREVLAVGISTSTAFIGGAFTIHSAAPRNGAAALDAKTGALIDWNPQLDSITPSEPATVYALAHADNAVYAAGSFAGSAGKRHSNIVALDAATGAASAWSPQISGTAFALAVSTNIVFVGGSITNEAENIRVNLLALDRATGLPVDWSSPNGAVETLAIDGDTLYAGGSFTAIATADRHRLAAFRIPTGALTDWAPEAFGPPTTTVTALSIIGNLAYVGGTFSSVGGQIRTNLAALELPTGAAPGAATAWNPAPNSNVWSIASMETNIYVAGEFTRVAGVARANLASLNADTGLPTSWNPIANGRAIAIVPRSDAVYVGGRFTLLGTGNFVQYSPNLAVFPPRGATPLLSGSLASRTSYQLRLEGNTGERYGIQATTNLVDWITFSTNRPVNRVATVTVPVIANTLAQFFRALFLGE